MASNMPGYWTLLCCGAVHQAVQRYDRGDTFVLPRGYRNVAVLGEGIERDLGYIIESTSTIIVALRGTKSVFDLLTDMNWSQIPYPYSSAAGATHRGFTELYKQKLRPQLLALLSKMSARKRLILSGHSLGGALATLAAPDLARRTRFQRPHVYSYGSPMVGNAKFAAAYYSSVGSSTRVMNDYDLVSLFPPSEDNVEYEPVGKHLALSFNYMNPWHNHDIRGYAGAVANLYPLADAQVRKQSPDLLP